MFYMVFSSFCLEMGGEHLSPEGMRFARRAFRKGWRVVTILAAISMMRVQPALPHRATLYRILGKDGREAPKKRGAPKKYFSKKRGGPHGGVFEQGNEEVILRYRNYGTIPQDKIEIHLWVIYDTKRIAQTRLPMVTA